MEIYTRPTTPGSAPTVCELPVQRKLPVSSETPTKQMIDRAARSKAARSDAALDRGLVERFNGGDESAFIEIMARHRAKILVITTQLLRNHGDAEEITQDTFIRAHRGLARFRGDSSLATWLHRIAVNLARNRYWYFFRRRRHLAISLNSPLSSDSTGTFSDLIATTEPDPSRKATFEEFSAVVDEAMQKLDATHREILTWRNLLHHSYDQIGRALGINEGTVKSRIARAREKLRGQIAEAHPEFPIDTRASNWFEPMRGAPRAA